jgi:hypothetical protein
MSTEKHKVIGPIKINFPDENGRSFWIFEDCAELIGLEFQSEAFKILKSRLKDTKPKPSMDYEADYLHISSANVDTILATIESIIELSSPETRTKFGNIDFIALKKELSWAKKNRPKPKQWQIGDVFSVPLKDNSFTIGQVLDKRYHCTCAVFDHRTFTQLNITATEFRKLKPISILHLAADQLNNGNWRILFNTKVTVNPDAGQGGKYGEIGSISYGSGKTLTDFAEVYWGLDPWNVKAEEDYYDQMLLKNVSRPKTAIVLNEADRKKYILEKYGIN